jgi:hypothetical protein
MTGERPSLQDRIRGRQRRGFVDRQRQVIQDHENLAMPLDDECRRLLFHIHGRRKVGKTLRQIANDYGRNNRLPLNPRQIQY